LADAFAVVFLAAGFFAAGFLADAFAVVFLAAGFFVAAGFFAVVLVDFFWLVVFFVANGHPGNASRAVYR
jgi:hypothetical protein